MKKRQRMISFVAIACTVAANSMITPAFEEETSVAEVETIANEPQLQMWTETYTYLADTDEPHATFCPIQRDGDCYAPVDVQYQVTEVNQKLSQNSMDLWAYADYEPVQELEQDGIHYTLDHLSTEEWVQSDRLQTIVQNRTYLEGQEIPETLEIETQDEVTGETIYGTIERTDLWEDGAAWQENGLEQWIPYSWNEDQWGVEVDGEWFYATQESPWFEGCEDVLLRDLRLEDTFYQITSVEWTDEGWQDEEENWKRTARVVGNRMVPRYQAVYAGNVAQADLPMIRYTANYTSDPQNYLVTATVTYEKTSIVSDEKERNSQKNEVLGQQFTQWCSKLEHRIDNSTLLGMLLAALAAVSVGVQAAVIFVLASHQRRFDESKQKKKNFL